MPSSVSDSEFVVHRASGFVVLPNMAINDERLSFRDRGLLAWMLGRPPGWRFSADRIAHESPTEGREAILTSLRRLRDAGYVRSTRIRSDGGLIQTRTEVADAPIFTSDAIAPESGLPTPVQPESVQPESVNPSPQSVQRKSVQRKSEQKESGTGEPVPGEQAARRWWESQEPRPAGGRKAWFSLVACCKATAEVGWTEDAILEALHRLGRIPTVPMLDKELRQPTRRGQVRVQEQDQMLRGMMARAQAQTAQTVDPAAEVRALMAGQQ